MNKWASLAHFINNATEEEKQDVWNAVLERATARQRATMPAPEEWPQDWPCKTDPRAPHGFDRDASIGEDCYVCFCRYWEPPALEQTQRAELASGPPVQPAVPSVSQED